jgi:hypothetical protein
MVRIVRLLTPAGTRALAIFPAAIMLHVTQSRVIAMDMGNIDKGFFATDAIYVYCKLVMI